MPSTAYQKFLKRFEEVTDLPPQTLGPLTPVYKSIVRRLKVMPLPWFVVASLLLVLALYYIVGSTVTFIVSLLQRGF